LETTIANHESMFSDNEEDGAVVRIGIVSDKLTELANSFVNGDNDSSKYSQYLESLEQLSILAESIHLDQKSLISNSNMLSMLQTQAGIRLLTCAVQASLARNESRGLHRRTDFPEKDEELLHHITVDREGNTGTLALRKSETGNWVLTPQ
jgi:succinate dehydrogenase/fumarate reductase flavoprotein subunit